LLSGLSATIGEAEKFNSWLASVQTAHGFKHSFIHHPHRYSHLRKFHYALQYPPKTSFMGMDTYTPTDRLRFLHPVSLLSFGARSLPSDFSLEAADCLTLYNAFTSIASDNVSDLQALDPAKFFNRQSLLKQKDVLEYESVLKDKLSSMIQSSGSDGKAATLSQVVRAVEDPTIAKLSPVRQNANPPAKVVFSNLIYLISDLDASGDLVGNKLGDT
jgi:ATP-dependent RNA helicase DDX60